MILFVCHNIVLIYLYLLKQHINVKFKIMKLFLSLGNNMIIKVIVMN